MPSREPGRSRPWSARTPSRASRWGAPWRERSSGPAGHPTSRTAPVLSPAVATRVLLVRHGQSEWNAAGRWQGQADPTLSDLGREQAALAAGALGAIDAI